MLYILFLYPFLTMTIFLYLNKIWSKRNPFWLNLFYSFTLCIFLPFEFLYWAILRSKYNRKTEVVLSDLIRREFKFHIVFGTLLFAFRDNNFKDTDIDICVFRDEFSDEQQQIVEDAGFVLKEQWSLDGLVCESTYVNKKHHISMDIFQISRGLEFAPTFDEKNNRYARRPIDFKYEIAPIKIGELLVNAPSDPVAYLEWNYGLWKVPDKNYHWFHGSSSSPTVIIKDANIEYKKFG